MRGTIPRISDASIITAFCQGVPRCSRSLRRTRWKVLPHFSPWLTSVPGPLRAVHGTQPPKTETPRLVAPVLPLRAVARRRRRTGVAGSRILADQSLQQQRQRRRRQRRQRLGARMHTANALARKVGAEVHAQCPPLATAPLTAARSKSSRSGSVGGVSSPLRTVHPLLASGPARRRPPTAGPRLGRRSWGTNPPLES